MQLTWTAILDGEVVCIFLERRKFEERARWKRRVSKTLVLCRGRFWSGSVKNPQNQSDLQSKLSNRFWPPCAKCTACAKCSELGVQIRGWCTLGTFCETKIAIFVKARGRVAKKWCMFANIHTKVRVDGLLREQVFRFEIADFREVNPVVQLVQNGGSDGSFRSTGFASIFSIEIRTSVMFSWSTFGLWWVACRMAFWTWCSSGSTAIDSVRTGNGLDFAFAGWKSSAPTLLRRCHRLHERAVGEERSAKIFHHHRTRNHPKELIPNSCSANYEARLPHRPVKTSHTTCRQGHDQQSGRTETSIFCLQNDATVRRTVTTFVCPQTQFHENLHTNFALQNLPIFAAAFDWTILPPYQN